MRKSVRKNDPGYDLRAYKCQVFVDGQKVDDCFTADEEKGEAWVFDRDKSGHFIIDNYGERPREKCLKGVVRIVMEGENGEESGEAVDQGG